MRELGLGERCDRTGHGVRRATLATRNDLEENLTTRDVHQGCPGLVARSQVLKHCHTRSERPARRTEMREHITKLDDEIEAYRTLVREQPDTASEVGKWMAQTVQDLRRLENLLGVRPTTKLTADDVKAMLASLPDITRSRAQADPDIKAAAYAELGITITYHADGRALSESRPRIDDVAEGGVGGGT